MSVLLAEIPSILTTIPVSLALCAICRSADIVIPCLTCNRPQCEECYSKEDDLLRTCKGCRMEKDLEMNFMSESPLSDFPPPDEEQEQEQEEEEEEEGMVPPPPSLQLSLGMMYHPNHLNAGPMEYLEPGVRRFDGLLYPTYHEWKHAENILIGHIQFTTSSYGVQQPWLFTKYLIGRMIHRFANHSTLTTDYMLSYEPDMVNPGRYVWQKYMSTYYNKSPCPYDENIFFPYPLPLQFDL
jgi:hypothetical protein